MKKYNEHQTYEPYSQDRKWMEREGSPCKRCLHPFHDHHNGHCPKEEIVQVSDDGWGEIYVSIVGDGDPEHDSVHTTRAKAERRAEALAKLLGCDWETNYP